MAFTLSQILAWRAGEMFRSSTNLRNMSSNVDGLVVQFTNASDLGGAWTGAAGQSAQNAATQVGHGVQALSRSLNNAAGIMSSCAMQMEWIQAQVHNAQMFAARANATLDNATGACRVNQIFEAGPDPTTGLIDPAVQASVDKTNADNASNAANAQRTAQDAIRRATQLDNETAGRLMNAFVFDGASRAWINYEAGRLTGHLDATIDKALQLSDRLLRLSNQSPGTLNELYALLSSMSPGQLAVYYEQLPQSQADAWAYLVSRQLYPNGQNGDRPIPPSTDFVNFVSHSAKTLQSGEWIDAANKLPFLEPQLYKSTDGSVAYQYYYGLPGTDPNLDTAYDINQGAVGDCYLLGTIIAFANRDPDFLSRNMVLNANGTVTITLYRDGVAIPVTVTNDVPVNVNDPGDIIYAHPTTRDYDVNMTAALYEKAFAQLNGGYAALHGGRPSDVMVALTGLNNEPIWAPSLMTGEPLPDYVAPDGPIWVSTLSANFETIAGVFEAGQPVTLGSIGESDTLFVNDAQTIVGNHVYAVIDVNRETQMVTIQNPWGANVGAPEFQEVSIDDIRDYFTVVSTTQIPK